MNPNCSASAAKKPATNSQTSLPACCPWKTQCFCQGGLLQRQAVIPTLQFQDGGEHPQRSLLRVEKALPETFCFPARTKTWFVLISGWRKKYPLTLKGGEKKKRREVRDLQVLSLFILKNWQQKNCKTPSSTFKWCGKKTPKNVKISTEKLEKTSNPRNPY